MVRGDAAANDCLSVSPISGSGRTSTSQVPDRVTTMKSGVCTRGPEPQPQRLGDDINQASCEVQREQQPGLF